MSRARFVYLAQPIDQAAYAETDSQVMRATWMLTHAGFGTYRPAQAWTVPPGVSPDHRVQAVNNVAMGRCDALLALLPQGVPTVGVPMEIERAARGLGIPVAIVGGEGSWALATASKHVRQFPGSSEGVVQAVDWLDQVTEARTGNMPQSQRVPLVFEAEHGLGNESTALPTRGHADDAGLDLYVSQETWCLPGKFVDVPTGIRVEMPPGTWGLLKARSSALRSRGLLVVDGVIDQGYRGLLYSGVWNMTDHQVQLLPGERVAQLILHHNATERYDPVWGTVDQTGTTRGTGGFGSTGV